MRIPLQILSLVAGLAAAAPSEAQTNWHVDATIGGPGGSGTLLDPYTSVTFAVDQPTTIDGDLLVLSAGTFAESAVITGKALRIRAAGGAVVTWMPQGTDPALLVTGSTTVPVQVNGVVFQSSGNAPAGSDLDLVRVQNAGSLSCFDCRFEVLSQFFSVSARCLRVIDSAILMHDCELDHYSDWPGDAGVWATNSAVTIRDSILTKSWGSSSVVLVDGGSNLHLESCTLDASADIEGSGVRCLNSTLNIDASELIQRNTEGTLMFASASDISISSSTLRAEGTGFGQGTDEGVRIVNSTIEFTDTLFLYFDGVANALGRIFNSVGLIEGCTFSSCVALDEGSCLAVTGGSILLTGCLFENNDSDGVGALELSGGHAVVDTVFRGNFGAYTAALKCGGGTSVRFCSFIDNTADNWISWIGYGVGAGVFGDGTTVIQDCLFLNNTAIGGPLMPAGKGAAIYAPGGLVQRCTFVGNECISLSSASPPGATVVAGTVEGCIFQNETPFGIDPSLTAVSYSRIVGPGGFGAQQVIWTGGASYSGARSVYATDIDGDGDADVLSADLVGSNGLGSVFWLENLGGGLFGPKNSIGWVTRFVHSVYAEDLDGDGDADVLSASPQDDRIAWYENLGGGVFGMQTITAAANRAKSVHATDLDGDGDADVLSASFNDDKIAWYENLGSGVFGPQQVVTIAANGAISVTATDLDGDGDADVLSASALDDKIAWYENLGGGVFGPQQVITITADYATAVSATDLDGDGDADVLSASALDDKIAWYENLGSGVFGTQQIISTSADYATSIYASDLDGDGDADVMSASALDDKIAWYENLGGGVFGTQQVITTDAIGAYCVTAMDLDGDGDMEVLSASGDIQEVAWYDNLSGVTGPGNITGDPLFWNPAAEDFKLRPGSPCIDTGDPNHPLDSNGSQADMGAYPHDPSYSPEAQNYCTAKVSAAGCVPHIGLVGLPTLGTPFAITADSVDVGRFGILVLAMSSDSIPFFGGELCLGSPYLRGPAVSSGTGAGPCDGLFSTGISMGLLGPAGFQPGDDLFAQYWYRDPSAPQPIGLSDAIRIGLIQ